MFYDDPLILGRKPARNQQKDFPYVEELSHGSRNKS